MRVVGLDLGEKRVGVALSDSSGTLALPHTVIERTGDPARDHAEIGRIVAEVGASVVVVGLPLSLDGSAGPAARAASAEAEAISAALGVEVQTHDERLTTVSAGRSLSTAGLPARARRTARRRSVDKVAAAVMLQSWLDGPGEAAVAHRATQARERNAGDQPGRTATESSENGLG